MSTGVAQEAMESLAARDLWIDRTPIRSKLLFFVWEPPASQGDAECMVCGIREGDAQCTRQNSR